jgi:hypothetical protein
LTVTVACDDSDARALAIDQPKASRRNLRSSSAKGNENKSKQNCFHLLSFSFPNLDFSMGYG